MARTFLFHEGRVPMNGTYTKTAIDVETFRNELIKAKEEGSLIVYKDWTHAGALHHLTGVDVDAETRPGIYPVQFEDGDIQLIFKLKPSIDATDLVVNSTPADYDFARIEYKV